MDRLNFITDISLESLQMRQYSTSQIHCDYEDCEIGAENYEMCPEHKDTNSALHSIFGFYVNKDEFFRKKIYRNSAFFLKVYELEMNIPQTYNGCGRLYKTWLKEIFRYCFLMNISQKRTDEALFMLRNNEIYYNLDLYNIWCVSQYNGLVDKKTHNQHFKEYFEWQSKNYNKSYTNYKLY